MKNIVKLFLFSGLIVFSSFQCNDEKLDPLEFKPIEIKKITDFGCEDCSIRIKPGWDNDTTFIILSEDEFNNHLDYLEAQNLPLLDFENYFLIIGTKYFPTWSEIIDEKAKENEFEIVYQVNYKIYGYALPGVLNYHAFIKKPVSDKTIKVELIREYYSGQ